MRSRPKCVSGRVIHLRRTSGGEKQAAAVSATAPRMEDVLLFAALPPKWLVLCVRACRAHPQQLQCVKSEKKGLRSCSFLQRYIGRGGGRPPEIPTGAPLPFAGSRHFTTDLRVGSCSFGPAAAHGAKASESSSGTLLCFCTQILKKKKKKTPTPPPEGTPRW